MNPGQPAAGPTDDAEGCSMSVLLEPVKEDAGGYRHEAFLYSGTAGFLAGTMSFISRAVDAGDPVLVILPGPKIDLLRRGLGAAAGNVSFADMSDVGGNPARIIAAWSRFADAHAGASQLCGIGESLFPGRSLAEIAECQLYEALLNVAFDASTPLWLSCPYDLEALAADVIEEARRSHPFLALDGERQACAAFRPIDLAEPYAHPLPAHPDDAACLPFGPGGLRRLRAFVAAHARSAGMGQQPATSLVVAVNEIATNSLKHGGGHGELRVWTEGRSLLCEVSDHGHLTSPLAGRLPPGPDAGGGLWLANQFCDLVQIYSTPESTAVRVHQRL
jgi:anti-sigma regulatory factor (Ser/Thr protein kinase)